jgi:preprotein translocase subunit YajC
MDTYFLIPMVAIMAIFYFFTIRPQQQRAKELRLAVDSVRRGDTVVTAGGIVGKVSRVKDDGEIMLEVADDVQVRVMKNTLTEVRSRTPANDTKADKS